MMAASVVRMGIAGKNMESNPVISHSSRSLSLHDNPIVTPPSISSRTTNSTPEVNDEDDDGGYSPSNPASSVTSSTGKQLAASSHPGPAASPVPSICPVSGDETNIALSQLKELDIAIEVRKVTKVDGRKTRWIEFRKRKQANSPEVKQEVVSPSYLRGKKGTRKSFRGRGRKANNIVWSVDINENSSPIKSEKNVPAKEVDQTFDKELITINNNNNISGGQNNMKADSGGVNNSLGNGPNTVLETMKQQFLQGTVNAPETTSNGVKEKSQIKKTKSVNGSPTVGANNVKRKPGRPKKELIKTLKVVVKTEKTEDASNDSLSSNGNLDIKIEQGVSQSPVDFYSRRNYLTKGLREVRKSESGSESGSSSPEKTISSNLSPSTPLPVSPMSPVPLPESNDSNSVKCPLISAAAKSLSLNSVQKKLRNANSLALRKKKILKKLKNENMSFMNKLNGHSLDETDSLKNVDKAKSLNKRRGRGRPKRDGETTTIIVDVHNTMNGEPQTVIPSNNPIVQRQKKRSLLRRASGNGLDTNVDGNSIPTSKDNKESDKISNKLKGSIVPVTSSSLTRVSSPTNRIPPKVVSSQSASKIDLTSDKKEGNKKSSEDRYSPTAHLNSRKSEGTQRDLSSSRSLATRDRPKTLNISNSNSKILNNNNIVSKNNNEEKTSGLEEQTIGKIAPKLGQNKSQGVKKSASMIIVSTAEAVKKQSNPSDKRLRTNTESINNNNKSKESSDNNNLKSNNTNNINNNQKTNNNIQKNNSNQKVSIDINNRFSSSKNTQSVTSTQVTNDTSPNLVPRISKPLIGKSPKKTPDKLLKSKSLNAVIEKLHSPINKKVVAVSNQASQQTSSNNLTSPTPDKPLTEEIKPDDIPDIKIEIDDEELKPEIASEDCKEDPLKAKESNAPQERLSKLDKSSSISSDKPKEKVPRFLKQLFQDEGVQNMLRSVNEEATPTTDGLNSIDASSHKLRPKRGNENFVSDSPEPDDSLYPNSKRKKRGTEVDNLFVDEGALNMLTSLEEGSRRAPQLGDDAASDTSQASSSKSIKLAKPNKLTPETANTEIINRKRKLSGSTSNKVPQITEPKKVKVTEEKMEWRKEDSPILQNENQRIGAVIQNVDKKKPGRPSLPVALKQKQRLQLQIQLKKQMKKLGIPFDNLTIAQMKELLIKAKVNNSFANQAVPPLKIKITNPSKENSEQQAKEPDSNSRQSDALNRPNKILNRSSDSPHSESPRVLHSAKSPIYHPQHLHQNKKLLSNSTSLLQPLTSLVRPLDPLLLGQKGSSGKLKPMQEGVRQSQRASVRQSEGSHYRDISLRKFNNFMQIILTPSTTKMKNSLNSRVLRELCDALSVLRRDESVKMVLLTSTGSTFCQGIDLTSLQHHNFDTRKKNAENLARGIKEFLRALVQFPKMIIAGVNGNAIGLGVTMLPLFDMVIATDKAEFFLPYSKLGQVPEGGATYTFPHYYGKLPSTKLFLGQKITASQAQQMGLVSEAIWPATFQQELIPKVALLATQAPMGMEGTKALMNHHILTKVELSVESECRLLVQQWTSQPFAHLCKRFVDSADIQLQKPVVLPL